MTSIKTVAVAGASGSVGSAVVSILLEKGFTVTALTRSGSTATFPSAVKVVTVDYDSVSSMKTALTDQDAVVSAVASLSLHVQPKLIEAAASAGVRRFIPCEYGADLMNPHVRAFPILFQKVEAEELLAQKFLEKGMSYTLLFTGLFLDWGLGLETGMILDVRKHRGRIYDGGDALVSTSTVLTVGRAIVACLERESETKNRAVYVQDIAVSQNQVLAMARKIQPDSQWDLEYADVNDLVKQADEAYASKDPNIMKMSGYVFRMYFGGKMFNQPFAKLDNELLGVKEMTEAELEDLVRGIALGDH